MQIHFESPDPEGAQLRDLATRRLSFALRRLAWLLPRAKVHLMDVNGPRGGVDKRCRLELSSDRTGTVVITSMAAQWQSALDSAIARAARHLLRLLQRKRRHPRAGHPALGSRP
ncbi:MAG: HPF/RaiA family ribosome-associated protein [Burkholderiaceae bacterium]